MHNLEPEAIARRAFAEIAARFPTLQMIEKVDAPVEVSISIPAQAGLKYEVWLGFQNRDELHFSVGNFWLEWFPCTKPNRVESYVEAVSGFLSGRYRVVEYSSMAGCFKSQLQRREGTKWRPIGTWFSPWSWLPFKKSLEELRNI